jgi:bisphosphoglycerate-independent phosphoglycerate mutase (AlkP superfamily)
MEYEERYTDQELALIIEQAMFYMCACPAQVAENLRKLRNLYRYQASCLLDANNDLVVHKIIANSTIEAHETLQTCLDKIIELEKWDRKTLAMPADLRKRQIQELTKD